MSDPTSDIGHVTVLLETPKAVRVTCHDLPGQPAVWVPRSVICSDSEANRKGQRGIMTTLQWFARSTFDKFR
jgi:hypothetical protein